MNEIYQKNMQLLEKRYIEVYEKLNHFEDSNRVFIDQSANGENILAVQDSKGRIYYLNSRYNNDELTDRWIEQYKDNNYQKVFIIFGGSNYQHIKKLIDVTDDTNPILIYEPDIEIFFKSIQVNDITEIIENKRVIICIKEVNDNYFKEFVLFALAYQKINITQYCCMQNYDILYAADWRDVMANIKYRFENIIMSRNTAILYSEEFIVNYLANCRDFIGQYSFNQLRDEFNNRNINELPAILVSAGPSLDKNIEELNKVKNTAFIIGVDTSLKTLLNHNIIPDIVVTVDSHKPPVLFMHTKFKNIPMLVCSQSNKELLPIYTGKRFYFDEAHSYMSGMYKSVTDEVLQMTESGGSVANNAFSMANVLGFKDIILVGQDLAYTGKKMHASAAYGKTDKDEVKNEKDYFEVEDIYGGKVLTESNMDMYRKWFEEQIVRYNKLNVIDATEGGAKINGTKIMTLSEAIETYCKKAVDIKTVIENIQPQFTEEKQIELEKKLDCLPEKLKELKKKLHGGIRNYERIEKLSRNNKTHTKEFKTIVKKIGKMTKFIEDSPELSIAALYNRQMEYGILGIVYEVKDNQKDEIHDICDKGIKMLKSYIDAIDSLIKDIEKMKKTDIKEIDKNIELIEQNIQSIKNDSKFEKIDIYMKDFYLYLLSLINMIINTEKNSSKEQNRDLIQKVNSYYTNLLEMLFNVVEKHENKEYMGLVAIMTELEQYIVRIGDTYHEL